MHVQNNNTIILLYLIDIPMKYICHMQKYGEHENGRSMYYQGVHSINVLPLHTMHTHITQQN
jgi:hypothetical protein